jgi:hypothetical protein
MPRYVIRVTPADIGARVSVRSRIPPTSSGATTTDTLGHLRSWRDGELVIERRDGSLARVAEADLVAGRVVPPTPPVPERRPR